MTEITDNTKVNALMLEELEQLRAESAELKQELITRVGELQTMSDENAALKAMVNELRKAILASGTRSASAIKLINAQDIALNKTPAQSLSDHCAKCTKTLPNWEYNMALAEKVLEAVYKTGWCSSNIYDDDVLDLTAIARGEEAPDDPN